MDYQFSPNRFSILPVVIKNLLIINGIMFLASLVCAKFNIDLSYYLGLHLFKSSAFMPHQLVTYMFMHANFTHLFLNMFALWMFGNILENMWGWKRFLLFYFICGIGAGIAQELVTYFRFAMMASDVDAEAIGMIVKNGYEFLAKDMNYVDDKLGSLNILINIPTVGASGAVYGLLLGFGMMFPESLIYIYFLIPVKAKWFVAIYAVIELVQGLSLPGDHVAHFAHLGGMLFGLIVILIWKKKGRFC